jgi:carboxymethylenebutenolidase
MSAIPQSLHGIGWTNATIFDNLVDQHTKEVVMEKSFVELIESFRKGLIGRREFAKRIVLIAGGVAAASQLPGLVGEAKAATHLDDIVIEEGTYRSGDEDIQYYLAKPAEGGPFPTMIVIHEIFGLSDFIKDVVRLFAHTGYLAMAPELLAGGGDLPDGRHGPWMLETIRTGIAMTPQDEIDKLNDGFAFLAQRDDVDPDHIGSVGFCWGGARSFTLATENDDLWVAVVFYGSTPPLEDLANIKAPVLALYGALDNGNASSITGRAAETARAMRDLNKEFEWEVYNMAPHAFFRDGDMVSQSRAATIAWELVQDYLDRHLE